MGLEAWYGDDISRAVHEASLEAVDDTTEAAANAAELAHWWESHEPRRNLETQTISEPARPTPTGVVGRFGSTRRQGFYGYFLELRFPWLRPAGDAEFPTLRARLREKFREVYPL